MPTSTIHHEKWCQDHSGPHEGFELEVCSSRVIDFGATMPHWLPDHEPYPRGSIYYSQDENEDEPRIWMEYAGSGATGHQEMPLHTLQQLARALNESPDSTIRAMSAIADELTA